MSGEVERILEVIDQTTISEHLRANRNHSLANCKIMVLPIVEKEGGKKLTMTRKPLGFKVSIGEDRYQVSFGTECYSFKKVGRGEACTQK